MAVAGCPFTDEQLLQAMQYVGAELDEATVASFEARLLEDLVLCEAVAEATRLMCLLKPHCPSASPSASPSAKPVLHMTAANSTARRHAGVGSKWLAPAVAVALLIGTVVVISRSGENNTSDVIAERSDVTGESDAIAFAEQLADLWSDPASDTSLSSRDWSVETQYPEASNAPLVSSTATSENDWILLALLPDEDLSPDGELRSEDDDEIIDDGDEATL